MRDSLPYRVIGALDTETSNYDDGFGMCGAFAATYQLGLLSVPVEEVTPENVRDVCDVSIFRDDAGLERALRGAALCGIGRYVPVVCVHNLSFDMHPVSGILARWNAEHGVRVLAKSPQKPITLALMSGDRPFLVLWDTLGFSGMGLEAMGAAAKFEKGMGEWDYSLMRAPQTPLTVDEEDYARRDIWALLAWLSYFLRMNAEIDPSELGWRVTTKTGVVRAKRRALIEPLRGIGMRKTVGEYWAARNLAEVPKDDDELFTVQACTRGGFVFCASNHAGVAFSNVDAFDAKSQHPAQMVSHLYPVEFRKAERSELSCACKIVERITLDDVLRKWEQPFPVAFCAAFEFLDLRPKPGAVYARDGIYPLAWARMHQVRGTGERDDDADGMRRMLGYCDECEGAVHAFGKVESAKRCVLYLTELAYWEILQCYEWDAMSPVHGYVSTRFTKPTDLSVLSVLEFYKRKDAIKRVRKAYYSGLFDQAAALASGVLPDYMAVALRAGDGAAGELEDYYMSSKADLNGLFGIEATNEARRDMALDASGIVYTGAEGVCNLPRLPKAWYQFGQRIVGWSRIAQHVVIQLLGPVCRAVVNGDTDSVKLAGLDRSEAAERLRGFGEAVDRAKRVVMERVRRAFPDRFDDLENIGYYEREAEYPEFYSAWNKAYCARDKGGRYHITLAGVPADKRREGTGSLEDVCADLESQGMGFSEICGCVLGYNTVIAPDVTKLNARTIPKFASVFEGRVTDWRGDAYEVESPRAIGIAPMSKTIGGFANPDNRENALRTRINNPDVMMEPHLIYWEGGKACVRLLR